MQEYIHHRDIEMKVSWQQSSLIAFNAQKAVMVKKMTEYKKLYPFYQEEQKEATRKKLEESKKKIEAKKTEKSKEELEREKLNNFHREMLKRFPMAHGVS